MGTKLASAVILIGVAVFVLWMLHVGPFSIPSGVNVAPAGNRPSSEAAAPSARFSLPSGDQIFKVAQAEGVYPRFVQVEINPPDVHVGDKQTLRAIIEDPNPIVSVVAETQLDHDKITLPLKLVGATPAESILPADYAVGSDGKLVILDHSASPAALGVLTVAKAASAAAVNAETYEASWVVRDTHNTTYRTTFIAKDSLGLTKSVTLAWSDACSIPASGNWTWSSGSCTISSTDGVDNGSTTVSGGTVTLNAAFAFNPGKSITISGAGSIVIGSGGYLTKAYLYYTDGDGDLYTPNATMSTSTATSVAGKVRRSSALGVGDCDDTSTSIYLGTTRTRYASLSVACGTASDSEVQTCQSSSVFSGTYTLTSAPSATQRTMYAALTSACGTYGSTSETQSCQSSGSWTGTYTLTSAPSATQRTRYAALTSACGTYGSTSETQYCQSSGSFNGTYTLTSAPSASTRTMYLASTVCSPTTCSSESQTCQSSGSWNGTYANTSCTSQSPTTWYQDLDGDTYGNPLVTTSACTQPSGYVANSTDCLDSNVYIYQNVANVATDADQDRYYTGSLATQCVGGLSSYWYRNSGGVYNWLPSASALGSADCNDALATVYRNLSTWSDADGDGYTANLATRCVGPASWGNYNCSAGGSSFVKEGGGVCLSTTALSGADCNDSNSIVQITRIPQYYDADGDTYTVAGSSFCASASTWGNSACTTAGSNYAKDSAGSCAIMMPLSGVDCYDLNANAKPGQTGYYTSVRGASNDSAGNTYNSFDYNCDSLSTVSPAYTGTYSSGHIIHNTSPYICSNVDTCPYCEQTYSSYPTVCGTAFVYDDTCYYATLYCLASSPCTDGTERAWTITTSPDAVACR